MEKKIVEQEPPQLKISVGELAERLTLAIAQTKEYVILLLESKRVSREKLTQPFTI